MVRVQYLLNFWSKSLKSTQWLFPLVVCMALTSSQCKCHYFHFYTSIIFCFNRWWFDFWCGPCCKGHKPFNSYSCCRAKRRWRFCSIKGCWKDHHIAFHKHHCWWTPSFSWWPDMVKQFALNIHAWRIIFFHSFSDVSSSLSTTPILYLDMYACLVLWCKCWLICFTRRFHDFFSWCPEIVCTLPVLNVVQSW